MAAILARGSLRSVRLLRQGRLLDGVLDSQRAQECQQIRALPLGQRVGLQVLAVEIGVVDPAAQHRIHGLFQRRNAAIVEVRRRLADVEQGRRLEGPFVRVVLSDVVAAEVRVRVFHADTDIVVLLVGQKNAVMAVTATRLLGEDLVAALVSALASPSRNRIHAEFVLTMVRSKAAMALATLSGVASWPNTAWNCFW